MKENKFGHEIHSATAPDAGVRIGSKTRKTPIPHAIQFQLCRHHPDIKKVDKIDGNGGNLFINLKSNGNKTLVFLNSPNWERGNKFESKPF